MKQYFEQLEKEGYTILPEVVSHEYLDRLTAPLSEAFELHRSIQVKNKVEIETNGVALHILGTHHDYVDFLNKLNDFGIIDHLRYDFFGSKFILNSFSALSTVPYADNFAAIVHRDIRFFSGSLNMMLNMLVMLDDFTEENGATLLLPYAHLKEEKPTDEYFHANAVKAIGKKGSILLFNSNVWHAAGKNHTGKERRAMPLTFSKPFMKQQMDYSKAIGYDKVRNYNETLKQLLGYYSRVPSNMDEFYTVKEERFYKKDQDL
jgi:ectoine hydroxylase-related dioxygenase (phytanoyl-CoA dioxygenase family)